MFMDLGTYIINAKPTKSYHLYFEKCREARTLTFSFVRIAMTSKG